jgi:glycogen debranching enzyme
VVEAARKVKAQSPAPLDEPKQAMNDPREASGACEAPETPHVGEQSESEAQFNIAVTGSPSRPRRTLKHNDTFAVLDSHGDIGATAGGPDGLFDRDTRYLSHLELLIEGTQPLLLGSSVRDDNLNLHVDLTNPDIYADDRIALPKDTVHIARAIYLHEGALHERIAVSNHGPQPVAFTLSLAFASDFADIFEVRGMSRQRRGRGWAEVRDASNAALHYRGLDSVARETALTFEPAPTQLMSCLASYELELDPGAKCTILATVATRGRLPRPTQTFFKGLIVRHREVMAATRGVASVETSNKVVNEILCRSMSDLYMLVTSTTEGPYPYAGIPWYSTTFGRDGIITALEMLWADPSLAEGVLRRLAAYQSRIEDPRTDASPGKILHEMRGGEMANLGEVPFGLYYGSVDATPLFIVLAGLYAERTGDWTLVRELWPAIERALAWLDGPADADGDGFVEYCRGAESGLQNQGWKDSHDSVFHSDGRLATGPIALVEVQGYVWAAKRSAAASARKLGLPERAADLDWQAEELRRRFEDAFWCEELGTYALALDGDKEPCRVRTSNAGHALYSGIARRERGRRVASGLLEPSFYSGWGIRTVAEGGARYNPMSYHNGSIWPHDNAIIAQGFARYGHKRGIVAVFEDLVRAATYMDLRRIPELYCGFRRRAGRGPTLYPIACSPQAWASGALFALFPAMLGLEFDPAARAIRLMNPVIPETAGDIVIRNLLVGGARADFALRHDSRTSVSLEVLHIEGDLQISLVFDPAAAA